MKCISIANQKGGVGKTTTSINIAFSLVHKGFKVLLIDLDPQGNASTGVGVPTSSRQYSVYDLLTGNIAISDSIVRPYTDFNKFCITPSSMDLAGFEGEFSQIPDKQFLLKKSLKLSDNEFDYVIIDCPPALGLLTVNAFTASDSVIVPVQCEFFALEGLLQLLQIMQKVKNSTNEKLYIDGILLTMYDKRNKLSEQVALETRKKMKDFVYNSVIPRNVKISEAQSHGEPILMYDPKSMSAKAYNALIEEIIHKCYDMPNEYEGGL